MKVKTSELEGVALDWAVAQIDPMCNGLEWKEKADSRLFVGFAMIDDVMQPCAYLSNGCCISEKLGMSRSGVSAYSPSTDWSQGGPLVDRHGITLSYFADGYWISNVCEEKELLHGATALIAACRAIVAAKIGEMVDVPEEFL